MATYIPATLDGVPLWLACLHVGMVEISRARGAYSLAQLYWCPDCGAHRQVVTSRDCL